MRDTSLFDEDFQAWAHGPVLRSVYDRFNGSAWIALAAPEGNIAELDPDTVELLEDILESYGQMGAKQLEELTHSEKPWREARGSIAPEARSENVISKDTMIRFYKDLYGKTDGEEQ